MKRKLTSLVLIVVLLLTTLLAGCKKDKEDVVNDEQGTGPWYKMTSFQIPSEENEFFSSIQLKGDTLWYVSNQYSENVGQANFSICSLQISDNKIATYPIAIEKEHYISGMAVADSEIYITTQALEWNSDYTKVTKCEYFLRKYDLSGNELAKFDITDDVTSISTEEGSYLADIVVDAQGNIYVSDDFSFILVYDTEGNMVAGIKHDAYANGFVRAEDGCVYYNYMNDVFGDSIIAKVDIASRKLEDSVGKLPGYLNAMNIIMDKDMQTYITEENTFKRYNVVTGEETKILNWLDYDIYSDNLYFATKMQDGTIVAYYEEYGENDVSCEVITLTETDEPLPQKIKITFAAYGVDYSLTDAVVKFNKSNDTYRVEIVDYSENVEDEAGYQQALDDLNQAILDGNSADIYGIELDKYMNYSKKGLFVDLYSYMENDTEVDKEDYFENVLDVYSIDDKLYGVPLSFRIDTLVGKQSVWGDIQSLTIAELNKQLDSANDDIEMMEYESKETWMYNLVYANLDNYIDWTTGECFFDTDEFIQTLEFCNRFPDDYQWSENALSTPEKIRTDKLLLYNANYMGIEDYMLTKAIFDASMVHMGYPGERTPGARISSSDILLTIAEDSQQKEGAWEFLRYLMSEEYQSNNIYWGNPINKAAFNKRIEEAQEIHTYVDESGVEVEMPQGTHGWDGFEINTYHATEEDVDAYMSFVEGAAITNSYHQDIVKIIEEEVNAYFEGQKTATEVANVIQGRVKIYVSETM